MQPAVIWLLTLLALGAAGLYLALAEGRRRIHVLAALLLAAAAGAMLALVAPRIAGGAIRGWFCVLSLIAALGAVRMITHHRPVYSALYFGLVVVAVTGLLVLEQATFLVMALLIVYAGAILVTYVFVIMLAQKPKPAAYDLEAREPFLGCVAGFVLLTVITTRLFTTPAIGAAASGLPPAAEGTALNLGARLLTDYVVALQLAGLLLLAAMVGAIAIARRKVATDGEGEET